MSEDRPRVAFVTSHPIQYQVPVFRCLAQDPDLEFGVFFAQIPDAAAQGAEFGVAFQWDLPLLEGYRHRLLKNVARRPSVTEFAGCDTPDIGRSIRDGGYDAIVVNGWVVKTCLQTLWACRRLRIPCLVRGEANLLRPRPWWKQYLQGLLVRRYDGYLYIGEENQRFYQYYGIHNRNLFPARYCIENDRFSSAAARVDIAATRKKWQIPPSAICYLFCGKFIEKKHPEKLLEAFRLASQDCPNIYLLMVGDGALRSDCEQRIRDHKLPVTLTGFLNQQEIIEAYMAADCLVVPSDHGETWGLVVNEAMACGRPAIVSDQVGCRRDLVHTGQTGATFRFGDWKGLSRLLKELATDRTALLRQGQAAQSLIARYSPQAAAEGIKLAVQQTLALRGKRRTAPSKAAVISSG